MSHLKIFVFSAFFTSGFSSASRNLLTSFSFPLSINCSTSISIIVWFVFSTFPISFEICSRLFTLLLFKPAPMLNAVKLHVVNKFCCKRCVWSFDMTGTFVVTIVLINGWLVLWFVGSNFTTGFCGIGNSKVCGMCWGGSGICIFFSTSTWCWPGFCPVSLT